jgi:multiple sugar transport system permease protein
MNFASIIILLFITVVFIFPIYWVFQLSIKPPQLNLVEPPAFVFTPTLEHYIYTFVNPGKNLVNLASSLIISLSATIVAFIFSFPASYAFSRFNFRYRNSLMFWFLSLLLTPPIVFTIPYYILMSNLGLRGTYVGLVIVYQTFAIPLTIWLLKSFIDAIPIEVEEAALIDGAGWRTILLRIILPICAPGAAVSMAFTFVFCWNNLIFPIILAEGPVRTLSLATFEYFTVTGATWNYIATCSFINILPPLIIFLLLRKYIVRGLTFGAVKG